MIFFRKISKEGGGCHFQSKNLCCRFWTFKQNFLSTKLIQNVQDDSPKMRLGGVKVCLELFQNFMHFGVGSGHPSLMVMMTKRRRKNAEAECLSAEVTTPLTRSCPETCRLPKRHSDTQIKIH